nr:MAG TPA: hypothetical protein [Caudoviricetes sp.]
MKLSRSLTLTSSVSFNLKLHQNFMIRLTQVTNVVCNIYYVERFQ